jgi:class 3 adenylate cyclase/DNA-binding beta-propeller fold protein YncE
MRVRASRDRRILAILFTDIVSSTETATALGDLRWRDLVAKHNDVVRRLLRRFHGRERDTAGDGFFATFDEPTEAARCALAIVENMATLGLEVRAGVHIGETERFGQKVGGINVVTTARLMGLAQPGEVLTSGTLRDLVAGSELRFEDRGAHVLKGVPGEWTVLRVLGETTVEPEQPAATRGAWRQVPLVPAALIGIAALGAVVVALIVILARQPDGSPSGPNTVTFVRADSAALAGAVGVGNGPSAIAVDEDSAWVVNADDQTISVIDRASREERSTQGGIGEVGDIAVGEGGVWIVDRFAGTLSFIHARTNQPRRVLTEQPGLSSLALGFGYVWVSDDIADAVLRVDPESDEVDPIELVGGGGPAAIAAGEGGVWVANAVDRSVTVIDPMTLGVLTERITLRHRPSAIEVGGGHVWVASAQEDALQRIDPASRVVTLTVTDVGDNPIALAATADGVWVALAGERAIVQLGADGAVLGEVPLEGEPSAIAVVDDEVWVTIRGT